jgi:HKD family nuclease
MTRLSLILQAATDTTHAAAIHELLQSGSPERVLISVGFARETGIEAVEDSLRAVAERATFFVGIRNDITTVQAIKRLLALNARVYAVDTGSRDTIFHPKVYLAKDKSKACAIVGSANLTFQGLHNNIEASIIVTLDMSDKEDRKFVDDTEELFAELVRQHPKHVFEIADEKDADELFHSGRLSDEWVVPASPVVNRLRNGERDSLPRMKLKRVARPRLPGALQKGATKGAVKAQSRTAVGIPFAPQAAGTPLVRVALPEDEFYLVWESKPLQERDLNIPKGPNTHVTGSMSLDRGMLESDNVDHRHFFYDDVFQDLKWTPRPKRPHLHSAEANFEVVIKGINCGKHRLTLSHNTNTQSKSYKQKNAMTSLRWGAMKHLIRNRDLMGRTLLLYRKDTVPPEYMIEID